MPEALPGVEIIHDIPESEKRCGCAQLTLYLDQGHIPIDNNLAKNAIRPFVVGKKNWLFCDTVAGTEASAALYSLIETARANKLNPYEYLKSLFEKLPYVESKGPLKRLLPQYHNVTDAG